MKRLVLFLILSAAMPAMAQQPRPDAKKAELDNLLTALKAAPSEEAASALEDRIKQIWLNSGSPAATLLMNRGMRDLQNDADDDAVADFDAALTLEPNLGAAYSRRALALFESGNYTAALRDIEAALQREPRDFTALQSLSRIAEARGDFKGALLAWKKSLEIDPKTPGGADRLRTLNRKANGEAT